MSAQQVTDDDDVLLVQLGEDQLAGRFGDALTSILVNEAAAR